MADPIDRSVDSISGLPQVLLAALEQTRSATCITTAQLDRPGPEIVYVNPAYCRMTGLRREDVIGATPRIMQGPLTDRAELDRLRTDLTAGRSFSGQTVNYRADGVPFIISWSIDPVRAEDGRTTHYVATQEDVTERVRTANLLAALRQLDDRLTSAMQSSEDAESGLGAIVEEIAAGATRIAAVGSVAVAVHDDDQRITVVAGHADPGPDPVELTFGRSEESIRGRLRVGLDEHHRDFVDRDGLEVYAARAGTVVAALVEYHRQRQTALRLQWALLPAEDQAAPGFAVVTRYSPGTVGLSVGGDWYDVTATDDRIVFSVGDVTGSGVNAAALMGRLRLLAAAELAEGVTVPEVMHRLGRLCAAEQQLATMIAAELDRASGEFRLWSAGHLPPVSLAADGGRVIPLDPGPPLGYGEGAVTPETSLALDPGAGLLLFTDGLVERRGESIDIGLARLAAKVGVDEQLDQLVDRLIADPDDAPADDVAILAFRRQR